MQVGRGCGLQAVVVGVLWDLGLAGPAGLLLQTRRRLRPQCLEMKAGPSDPRVAPTQQGKPLQAGARQLGVPPERAPFLERPGSCVRVRTVVPRFAVAVWPEPAPPASGAWSVAGRVHQVVVSLPDGTVHERVLLGLASGQYVTSGRRELSMLLVSLSAAGQRRKYHVVGCLVAL